MFHVEHSDSTMTGRERDADSRKLPGFPAIRRGGGWFADENPPSRADKARGPQHGRIRGGEPSTYCSVETAHPVAIIRQGLDIGANDPCRVMKVKGANRTVNEIRSFFPPVDHCHPQVGPGNGQDESRNACARAKIDDGPHVIGQRRHERLGVRNDLGNGAGTEHADPLRLAQQAFECCTRNVRGQHASQRRCSSSRDRPARHAPHAIRETQLSPMC